MNLTGLEATAVTLISMFVAGILGFLFGGIGKISKAECKGNHDMLNALIQEIYKTMARVEENVKSLREEVKCFQDEARREDRVLHDRITAQGKDVTLLQGALIEAGVIPTKK
jgi:transcriptional regulator CtsR